MSDAATKLSGSRIAAYGFGDFGFNLFYTGLNLYLLFYYTDVLGIAPTTAGVIFMIPVIWDAVTDPVMGSIATRTRTRWGSYRPFILFGAPMMAVSFVGMFAAPLLLPGAAIAACLISHIIFRTAYTVVSIPYTALSAAMTKDGAERSKLAGARMVCAVAGGVLTAYSTLLLAKAFGGVDLAAGFVSVAILFATITTAIMVILFFTTSEDVAEAFTRQRLSLAQSWLFLRKNNAFWLLFSAVFASALGASIANKALVYYVTYVVGDKELVSPLLALYLLSTGVAVPIWAWVAQRYSKRDVWLAGAIFGAFLQGFLLILAPAEFLPLLVLICLSGLCNAAFITMFWAMLPDTVEFGEWRSGFRDEGIVFGLNQLALKAASGIGVGLLGILLGQIGYVANEMQTAETLEGLRWLSFGVPLGAAMITIATIWKYPITNNRHRVLVKVLRRKNFAEKG